MFRLSCRLPEWLAPNLAGPTKPAPASLAASAPRAPVGDLRQYGPQVAIRLHRARRSRAQDAAPLP
jgi:hypothetical protein